MSEVHNVVVFFAVVAHNAKWGAMARMCEVRENGAQFSAKHMEMVLAPALITGPHSISTASQQC